MDEQTGRGIPMVELMTTSSVVYETDSNGLVAFNEPGLMNQKVFFSVASHGYESPKDGFGIAGVVLQTKPGTSAKIKLKRINIAERLYRITGQGIYRDTVLLGRKPPIEEPLLNAQVTGQDGTLNVIFRGKLYWFYGDTLKLGYALGNFSMTGATTDLPEKIDPSVGFDLHYFAGKDGFVRAMAPVKGEGVTWLYGLVVLPDELGQEQLYAYFQRRKGLGPVLENGFMKYNPAKEEFEKLSDVPVDPPFFPQGYPFSVKQEDGSQYIYFTGAMPALRVKAEAKSYLDLSSYEAFTPLKEGTRSTSKDDAQLEDWAWKKNTPPLNPKVQKELFDAGKLKAQDSPHDMRDVDSGKPILINNCSVNWNVYRKKYIMIACQEMGDTMLGEIWYAESDKPQGPWLSARKIITHANKKDDAHDFYNPVHHPFFDQDGGRVIYLEGSYVNTFSGNKHATPYYEYNQIMYRLDLSDPRLDLNRQDAKTPRKTN
ncbi:MAG TPA: hypothetical protein VL282_17635 [Tepidisphaeraceae bacterium]|nr:hypothetical protein [Tepidisphaeraceae bacterium]